jgi:hypothetical protein
MADAKFPPLASRPVRYTFRPENTDQSPGRQLRALAALLRVHGSTLVNDRSNGPLLSEIDPDKLTFGEAAPLIRAEHEELFERLDLRVGSAYNAQLLTEIPDSYNRVAQDPSLHGALQDLADEINEDIREALFAFDSEIYYPGIDEGIEPMNDEHVKLVIWAMQRELNRELRAGPNGVGFAPLPPAPLAQLPWEIQRALAERRRYRYVVEYGISREDWQEGVWSVWKIREDPDWIPRRALRLSPSPVQ